MLPVSQIIRYAAILLFILGNTQLGTAQCHQSVGCIDCFHWCPDQTQHCEKNLFRSFCRLSCQSCPNATDVCLDLSCEHSCDILEDGTSATCSCFEGFELASDRRRCVDIDECAENPGICNETGRLFCNNTIGSYICTSCNSHGNLWQYYNRGECCQLRGTQVEHFGTSSTNGRIVGGEDAAVGRWPWTTYILIGNNLCGGSLITREWVLTGGHCVASVTRLSTIRVIIGVFNTTKSGNIHQQTFNVREIIIHPDYGFPTNDIALLRLDRPALLSHYVRTICLPNGHEPAIGETCYATGYGTTRYRGSVSSVLQEVDLPIIPTSLCQDAYRDQEHTVNPEVHLCAGYVSGGKDTCQGDSGGPLVCQRCNNCDWYIAGITSFGKGCATPGFYGVYSRVKNYEEWITTITNQEVSSRNECIKPSWHEWGGWTNCSAHCGTGRRSRIRYCQNGPVGVPGCTGNDLESSACNIHSCFETSWSSWTIGDCSEACAGGMRRNTRTCENGNIGDSGCEIGGDTADEECNTHPCPSWNAWDPWSSCSVTCGGGNRDSSRTCNNYGIEGATCDGSSTRSEPCNEQRCPRWGRYTQWSECDRTCGGGMQFRTRRCVFGTPDDIGCHIGIANRTRICNRNECEYWGGYGEWSSCSETCGDGMETATRTCFNGEPGYPGCPGSDSIMRSCNVEMCGDWTQWGSCPVTCGGGTQTRQRNDEIETRDCEPQTCPSWGSYGAWSDCTRSCDRGTQNAMRECQNGNVGQDGCLGSNIMRRPCNTHQCNYWAEWVYGECSRTCENGTIIAERVCIGGVVPGTGCEGSSSKTELCNTQCCPHWDDYGPWGECSVTCGGGMQFASRACICGDVGQIGCDGSTSTSQVCSDVQCPEFTEWTSYGPCSESCGGGETVRTRECPQPGLCPSDGYGNATSQTETCNEQICPVFTEWTSYGPCSESCGGGESVRTRECPQPGLCPSDEYGDATSQTETCNEQICPGEWTNWYNTSDCSMTCGTGLQQQNRDCIGGVAGGLGCEGDESRTIECYQEACPAEWGPFGDYFTCSATCGGGFQTRRRICMGGSVGSGNCIGSAIQQQRCNTQSCITSACGHLMNSVLYDAQCWSFVQQRYCETFFEFMEINCPLECCLLIRGPCAGLLDFVPSCAPAGCGDPTYNSFCPATCCRLRASIA